ncbi:NADH flavin oxidoreductase [Rhizoctonia solani]|uniref:NADH flavin oxidoreductase n=1 Tax=Rhizoctonia solani TaxID=456999 RepID=A0A8H7I7T7_9AGAM|nr:NADH flavin oxidoreductase [Rhizoctonia solani]
MTVISAPHLWKNTAAPGVEEFYPLNEPPIGTPYSKDDFPRNKLIPKLFQSLHIRGVEFKNRIWVAPMAQYSAVNGHMTDWHLVHLGSVVPELSCSKQRRLPRGRHTPEDPGIWSDTHIAPMKRIVDFIHGQGGIAGIQFAHAGRKASALAPFVLERREGAGYTGTRADIAGVEDGGWPERKILQAYADAVERSKKIGFDSSRFMALTDISFTRSTLHIQQPYRQVRWSLENRLRFPLEVIRTVRAAWDKPLFFRFSATDWAETEKDES